MNRCIQVAMVLVSIVAAQSVEKQAPIHTLDKVADLELRLLAQKVTTTELQIKQLQTLLQSQRAALNTAVETACKNAKIDISSCGVSIETVRDGSGGEHVVLKNTAAVKEPANTKE